MTPDARFALALLLTRGLPTLLAAVWWWLGRPRHAVLRGGLAIGTAWALSVVLTSDVYNPAGIAAGHARDEHFPEGRYDNNTIVVAIVGGWVNPVIAVLVARIVGLCRTEWRAWRARRLNAARTDPRPASPGSARDGRPARPPAGSS